MARRKDMAVHPGEILLEEFLRPMGLSRYRLAKRTGMPLTRVSGIVRGRRSITADTALRLGRFFGNSPRFWMNLQSAYDLREAERTVGRRVAREVEPVGG